MVVMVQPIPTITVLFLTPIKTPTYLEGQGVTIPELLTYVKKNSLVADVGSLTYAGSDILYFTCCDGASVNFTYDALYGTELNPVNRYYYPALYDYWDSENVEVPDADEATVLASGISAPVYLATVSKGGRVFASAGGTNISSYVTANDGVVSGCLAGQLTDEDALRLIFPQTASDIQSSTDTLSFIKKWVYKVRLKTAETSPIASLGTISNPTCTYTLDGTTLTITMSCEDANASLYYSTIGGYTATPVNLYTEPITVENYDTSKPFTISVMAVREGYVNSTAISASSANYTDGEGAPSFTYALTSSDATPTVGTAFDLSVTLAADKDYTLYGAEYRVSVPAAYTVNSVTLGTGWQYGTATYANEATIVTFTYLNTTGTAETATTAVPVGSINLIPVTAGDTSVTVSEAIVTKSDATAYTNITAADSSFTVESNITLGDVDSDSYITMGDALQVCKTVAKVVTLNDDQKKAADVDKDGYITMSDALLICKYVAKVISEF